jgi:chemotaxis protein methyltransferase CheR
MSESGTSLSVRDLDRLRSLIYEQSGIVLGPDKKTMLELRIKPRLRSLTIDSFSDYCNYLFSREGQEVELPHLLDVVTTNKTDFFRESAHFDFLVKKALPERAVRSDSTRPLLVWSAGCSSGEEPYTLAMVLSEYAAAHPGFRFKILATDICNTVLAKAKLGVFKDEVLAPVSPELRRKYLMRSRDPEANESRVVPELRQLIEFRRLNFMDAHYGLSEKADMIFCRNVIIYFDRATQENILGKLIQNLVPGGYAFLGHSETLNGFDLPLTPVAPALYRKSDASVSM